jgi:integrase
VPSLDEIRKALGAMPTGTLLERRDRAVVAFTLASGARDDAIASLSLKHIDLAARMVFQDARMSAPKTPRPLPRRSSRWEVTSRRLSSNGLAS